MDCNLRLENGQTLAICGNRGSGKTTILHLLSRFYDISQGRILLDDNIDLRVTNPQWLRSVTGLIPQNHIFLNGSIKENIMLSLPKSKVYSESMVIEASKKVTFTNLNLKADIHDFIISLPFGYNTILGHGGIDLDMKQKFSLCLLFVLLGDPLIVLIDSSSTAPDLLSHALSLFNGKIIIFTSNSPPSVKTDQILNL